MRHGNGGAAFPRAGSLYCSNGDCDGYVDEHGMSLRDWFAGLAMQSIVGKMATNSTGRFSLEDMEKAVDDAFAFAHLMLEARESVDRT